jgi:hypothetical protein
MARSIGQSLRRRSITLAVNLVRYEKCAVYAPQRGRDLHCAHIFRIFLWCFVFFFTANTVGYFKVVAKNSRVQGVNSMGNILIAATYASMATPWSCADACVYV